MTSVSSKVRDVPFGGAPRHMINVLHFLFKFTSNSKFSAAPNRMSALRSKPRGTFVTARKPQSRAGSPRHALTLLAVATLERAATERIVNGTTVVRLREGPSQAHAR